MKIAYFNCFAGAGGDMIAAAMLDTGLDAGFLRARLATLGIKGLDLKIDETRRAGLRAMLFEPVAPRQDKPRNLQQIKEIVSASKIGEKAKETAVKIFERLAEAEGSVHGKEPGHVHFHELGAVDSIVDIVSACVGIEALGIERVFCSPLRLGGGMLKSAHGLLPVPAPATAELLKGVPVEGGPGQVELLTPTAAAILTTVVERFGPLPEMRIEAIGNGAGSLDPEEFPNILRLFVGETTTADSATADTVCLLETNLDDATGEIIGSVVEGLFERGALDVFTTPIVMKHSRPGVQLSIMCKPEDAQRLEEALLEQGLTFGVRRRVMHRRKLPRGFVRVQTPFGEIRIKTGLLKGKTVAAKPEFSDCAAAAKTHNVAVKFVMETAVAAYLETLPEGG
jgi:uncharacterized protein (TIGR00299 family) protein